jgi:hypothetical protein
MRHWFQCSTHFGILVTEMLRTSSHGYYLRNISLTYDRTEATCTGIIDSDREQSLELSYSVASASFLLGLRVGTVSVIAPSSTLVQWYFHFARYLKTNRILWCH